MNYDIEFSEDGKKDLKKLSHPVGKRVLKVIEQKLTQFPDLFGKPLRANLKNLWSLRVGSYRVIYQIQDGKCIVFVIAVGKRETIYEL